MKKPNLQRKSLLSIFFLIQKNYIYNLFQGIHFFMLLRIRKGEKRRGGRGKVLYYCIYLVIWFLLI